mmetsp:Transcript_2035/g.4643  ORF Transcript_2035/g.4643 Transcript_2035/m.4643 type:complete len:228 (+) Transcript_2035:785-1468(+)
MFGALHHSRLHIVPEPFAGNGDHLVPRHHVLHSQVERQVVSIPSVGKVGQGLHIKEGMVQAVVQVVSHDDGNDGGEAHWEDHGGISCDLDHHHGREECDATAAPEEGRRPYQGPHARVQEGGCSGRQGCLGGQQAEDGEVCRRPQAAVRSERATALPLKEAKGQRHHAPNESTDDHLWHEEAGRYSRASRDGASHEEEDEEDDEDREWDKSGRTPNEEVLETLLEGD